MAKNITTDIKIWNIRDEVLAEIGIIKEDEIKLLEFKDIPVDTGATRLILPSKIVKELNFKIDGKTRVIYADKRKAEKEVVVGVRIEVLCRKGTFDAIVENRDTPLVGMKVLQFLDLWPDPQTGKLRTNPESPDMPLYNLL